jgi:starvation-inducible DNA-binding protein
MTGAHDTGKTGRRVYSGPAAPRPEVYSPQSNQRRETATIRRRHTRPAIRSPIGLTVQMTHNTLSENIRALAAELLNRHLAAAIDLHGQIKQAHWNVRGPTFIAIHELFDKVAIDAEAYSDQIAERAAALGAIAEGTVQVAAANSFLVPYPLRIADEKEHIFAVASTLAGFGQSVREAIGQSTTMGDADTADLFTQISRGVDHQIWLVESHAAPR